MKLYTEEQVRKIYNEGCWDGFNEVKDKEDEIINQLTPIELPSDEEIENADFHLKGKSINFIKGAKWVIEQIKQQADV